MDRLTAIEAALKAAMLNIDGSTLSSGYIFYNDVTTVNIDDEALATNMGDFPTVAIYIDPDGEILEGEQHAYREQVNFRLVVSVSNEYDDIQGTTLPRFAINEKMNTMLSDIKAEIGRNYQLGYTCDLCSITGYERDYTTNGDALRAGDLIVFMTVDYSQSRLNPNNNCAI